MKRSKFSLSHYKLLTMEMGQLVPVSWYEALPGDTIQQQSSVLIRATPLTSPVMHPVRVRMHTFFVPNRIIWEDWEDFITGGDDGKFEAAPPTFTSSATVNKGGLADYLGIPPGDYSSNPIIYSALPTRAYNLIYNDHFRDQDITDPLPIGLGSGDDQITTPGVQRVAWEKDYFSTLRPWTSKGDEIYIPLGTTAPVSGTGTKIPEFIAQDGDQSIRTLEHDASVNVEVSGAAVGSGRTLEWSDPKLVADLSQATGISINDLRNFLALQRFQEARAQFGSRYSEYLKYLAPGIGNLDSRLQEPEYISGGASMLQFSEILQTQRTDEGESPLGTLAGHGISAMRTRRFRKFIPEHGIVMTLLSVVPKAIYSQAVERKWHRMNKEMYFQKELQFIGEQPVTNREIYSNHSDPTGIFGYGQRYDEYRYNPSGIAGEFHDTVDNWHFARIYGADVALNDSWLKCNPGKRPFADQVGNTLYVMANQSIQARRILVKYPTPRTF